MSFSSQFSGIGFRFSDFNSRRDPKTDREIRELKTERRLEGDDVLEKYKLVPNWPVTGLTGETQPLWDYRQKSHVILLHLPQATPQEWQTWKTEIAKNKNRWSWLNAVFVTPQAPSAELPAGVYVIDRYGRLWNSYTPDGWTLTTLETDLVYYEARHC